ncbi:hypothetical protein D9758_004462 [Tetrapyrgos nigripes]|uniref:C2H2-type domain-containing protein n=1 Tax=Tetrapyrgos nigripes TaxID=182062 RepID=A0A8H5GMQ2_9AGAR|nr:hypothetical protein D9758_004462 [Tetrapyrgos nigripes]
MSHIFTLEDLARCKVCLEFTSPGQPPSIHWRPLNWPVTLNKMTSQSLSIRVNESFVNGRPSLTLFLVHDPESAPPVAPSVAPPVPVHPPAQKTDPQPLVQPSIDAPSDLSSSAQLNTTPQAMETDSKSSGGEYSFENWPDIVDYTTAPKPASPATSPLSVFSPASWSSSDSTRREERSADPYQDSPISTTPMETMSMENDAALLTSLMSLDMLFGNNNNNNNNNNTTLPSWTQSPGQPSSSGSSASSPETSANACSSCNSVCRSDSKEGGGVKRSQGTRQTRRNSTAAATNRPLSNPAPSAVESSENTRRGPNVKGVKKRVKCSLCNETFSRRHDMMRHEASQHGKVQDWTCERCRRFFSSEAMLSLHRCPALLRRE